LGKPEVLSVEQKLLPRCHRCGQHPQNGLYDGFRIAKVFFCRRCEEELLALEIGSLEYRRFAAAIGEALFPKRLSPARTSQSGR